MIRPASLGHFALGALSLALCSELSACTKAAPDLGPTSLERHVDDSGINQVLAFDGVDDYATTATAEFPAGLDAYTLSTWFRLSSLTGKQAFITVRKDFDSGLGLGVIDGVLTAWRVFSDKPLLAAPDAVTVDTWHHAAYTFDTTTNRLYLDGALVASSTTMPDKRTPLTCLLGTLEGTSELLHGSLDDVHVFDVQRTAEQIASELTEPVSPDAIGLVMSLPFDESEGPIIYDHSSLENDGLLGDGITARMPHRVSTPKSQESK
ncbi:MAG: LamG domain-containing protein [Myxococcales bacterium]